MPNIVNESLYRELENDFRDAGSLLILQFDGLTVAQDEDLRNRFRDAGVTYKVVKNRLAKRAARAARDFDLTSAFAGKCGLVIAAEEGAITAAKLVREAMRPHRKSPPVTVVGGVIEGEPILGDAAAAIADMPDRETVRTMIATAISGPARGVATVISAVGAGMARCIQAKIDEAED